MAFTAGYKVNEGTQYEFTVSNETIQEMVQASDTGIGEADLGPYCYSALIDSRVHSLKVAQGSFGWPGNTGADFAGIAKESCPGIIEGWSEQMTSEHPAFNKDLLDTTDVVYQRNFLVWEGTIYPGTENEKTGDFLIMDIVDIKRWYVNFDNNGFGTANVTSAIGEEAPEGYVWPGYTGPIYTYISNVVGQAPVMHCDNNDPHLNPNTKIRVRNILVINDEYWVGSFNPSTHCNDYMGGSGCSYAGKSIYGYYWNGGSNGGYLTTSGGMNDTYYQRGSLDFMGLPDYSNAPELPGAPRNDIGSLSYNCYAVTDSDNVVVNLAGNWGQQNYASGISFVNNSATTQLTSLLKWQSWCGLKFQYQDTMYKPIIQDGVIVGYSDDMEAESEYDDMTNVTGNNIPIVPPGPAPQPDDDDPWDGVDFGGSSGGGGAFAKFYYMTSTELANLRSWMNSNSVPEGFNPMAQIIGLSQVPVAISGSASENVVFVNSSAVYSEGQNRLVDSGVATQRGLGRTIVFNLGSVDIPRRMQQRGEPYLDYSCAIELYLPFCGIFSLDTQAVMGRTITAQLVLDPTSGSITGYAWVSESGQKLPVAYGSGQVGIDLPISAQQYGMSRAALSQANANVSQSILQSAMGLIAAVGTSGMGAAESAGDAAYARGGRYGAVRSAEKGALASEAGTYVASQASSSVMGSFMNWGRSVRELSYGNNTAISGSFGGSYASWSNPFTAYVKIIRPKVQKPSNYNHTQAVPCVEARTVASCTGLIQCIGVDTSSISNATSIERNAIAEALSNGVYAGR